MNRDSSGLQLQDIAPEIAKRVEYWLTHNFDQASKEQIKNLIEHDREGLINAFYTDLSFGTGGLRGIMGVGSNRMNLYTVGWASQGLSNYLHKVLPAEKSLRVAIGYDSRKNSKEFAELSAEILSANNIEAHIFSELRPTPLVSFLCRYHKCHAAIMVTASHNPPEYNGYKVYWADGAQVLTPHDVGIIEEVTKLHDPDEVQLSSTKPEKIIHVQKEVDSAYLDEISKLQIRPNTKTSLSIAYSSLHGTGITLMKEALKRFGFSNVSLVDAQCIPDGTFPTCHRPNPEEKEALTLGMQKMLRENQDIFIATDPDADRMGVVVRHNGDAVILNGNQIACLCVYFICKNMKLSKNAAFVKTIVTTELFRHIVEAHGAACFDVLTGFKYIAEKIRMWEQESSYDYIFGAEESYGYLLGTHVRDKDAIIASCLTAETASYAKEQNKTLVDLLDEIYLEYGLYSETLFSINFEEGRRGKEEMQEIMASLRKKPPTEIANEKIVRFGDLLEGEWHDLLKNEQVKSDLPKSDVLVFDLQHKGKIIVRPSGTEPKVKVYLMLSEPKGFTNVHHAKEKLEHKAKHIQQQLKTLFKK